MGETRILAGGKRPRMVKARASSWTDAKRETFIGELAATCSVTAACDAAQMSSSAAYRERQRNASFRAGWASAIAEAYVRLEIMLVERAMNGVVKLIERANGDTERVTEYSDRVALQLLRQHKELAHEAQDAEATSEEEADTLGVRLERYLSGVRRGLGLDEEG